MWKLKRNEEAVKSFEAVLRINPNNTDAQNMRQRLLRQLSQLSLFLVFLTFPSVLPISSKSFQCTFLDWSAQASDFGRDGRNGSDGQTGRRGRDGQSQTVFANGSSLNLDLSASDGEDGLDGREGENADCARQPREVDHNLQAAKGGNGGDGGDGGNGGSLTVYYSNLADLKKYL